MLKWFDYMLIGFTILSTTMWMLWRSKYSVLVGLSKSTVLSLLEIISEYDKQFADRLKKEIEGMK